MLVGMSKFRYFELIILILTIASFPLSAQEFNPQFRKPVDCSKLRNGNYVFGCSGFWSICSNNIEYPMKCPTGLVLNPENDQCNEAQKNPVCSKDILALGDRLYRSKDPFSCKGRLDGNYEAEPCSSFYFQCHQDNRNVMPCPIGTVFNPANGACDYTESCEKFRKTLPILSGVEIVDKNSHLPSHEVVPNSFKETDLSNYRRSSIYKGNYAQNSGFNNPSTIHSLSKSLMGNFVPKGKPVLVGVPLVDTFILSQAPVRPLEQQSNQANYVGPNIQSASKISMSSSPSSVFNCVGRQDAIYLWKSNACTQSFWKCSNGQPFKYDCPDTLFYNAVNGECDYKHNIVACNAKARAEPVNSIPKIQPQQVSLPAPILDTRCVNKKDDHYSDKPCIPYFYVCIAGVTHQFKCPSELVYDIVSKNCEFLEDCGKSHPILQLQNPITQGLYHGGVNYFNKEQSSTLPNLVFQSQTLPSNKAEIQSAKGSQKFNCSGREDGYYYKKACSPTFIICSAGQISEQSCPENLLFDPATISCQYPDNCGKPILTTTQTSIVRKNVTEQLEFNCTGLNNGYYVKQPCTTTFYTCDAGHTIKVVCPPTLVYDPILVRCDYPHECGRLKKNQSTKSIEDLSLYPIVNSTTTPRTPVNFDCTRKKDGYYAKENCQSKFLACANGIAIEINCPDGLVFDIKKTICDWIGNCGKDAVVEQLDKAQQTPLSLSNVKKQQNSLLTFETTTQTSKPLTQKPIEVKSSYYTSELKTQEITPGYRKFSEQLQQTPIYNTDHTDPFLEPIYTTHSPQLEASFTPVSHQYVSISSSQQQTQQPLQSATILSKFSCADRKDGYYIKRDCTSAFFVCSGGIATKQGCPGNLLFDISTTTCEFPETCGKTKPITTTQTPRQVIKPDFDCSHLNPGNYALGKNCANNNYVTCSNGVPYSGVCPAELVFDEIKQICTYVENCQLNTNNDPTPQVFTNNELDIDKPVKLLPIKFSTVTISNSPQVLAKPSLKNNCGNLTTGTNKISDCSQRYKSCWQGQVYEGICYDDLFYNPANGFCDYKNNVAGCNNAENNFNSKPTVSISEKNAFSKYDSTISNYSDNYPITSNNYDSKEVLQEKQTNCQGKHSGFHSSGCTSNFFHCNGGQTLQLHCSTGLFYDSETESCQYRDYVQACGNYQKNSEQVSPIHLVSKQQSNYKTTTTEDILTKCSAKEGYFSVGCSSTYFACISGIGYAFTCPQNILKYSEKAERCDFSENVPECGGKLKHDSQTISTNAPGANPSTYTQSQVSIQYSNEDVKLEKYTQNRFIYNRQKKPVLKALEEIENVPLNIPSTAYKPSAYLPKTSPASIVNCSKHEGGPASQFKPYKEPAVSASIKAAPVLAMTLPTIALPKFDCSKHKDGYVADGCSNIYFSCSLGIATPLYCPGNLKFSVIDLMCEEDIFVPECGGKSRPKEDDNRSKYDNFNSINDTSNNVVDYSAPGGNPCSKLKNGTYAKQCSRSYFVCTNHKTFFMFCQDAQVFDAISGRCTPKLLEKTCQTNRNRFYKSYIKF